MFEHPIDRINPNALGAAAAELAQNPYFLRSRSISPATISPCGRQSSSDRTPSIPNPEPGLLVHKATLLVQYVLQFDNICISDNNPITASWYSEVNN